MEYKRDIISNLAPQTITKVSAGSSIIYYRVAFNVLQKGNTWSYDQLLFLEKDLDYDDIVNKLIVKKYPQDKMEAVINNYLLDPEENKKEFLEMQQYRKDAKQLAKEILKYKEQN